jgi:hypothetical protein
MPNRDAPNAAPVSEKHNLMGQNPIHHARHLKVICIGAGASGLLLAYKLQRSFENFELLVYEKNDAVSGTWYENKYPGCVYIICNIYNRYITLIVIMVTAAHAIYQRTSTPGLLSPIQTGHLYTQAPTRYSSTSSALPISTIFVNM